MQIILFFLHLFALQSYNEYMKTSDKFVINGGHELNGSLSVPKAKNSYLAILAACALCDGQVLLHECPHFDDIDRMIDILTVLGIKVERIDNDLLLDCRFLHSFAIPSPLAKQIRSSIFMLGPLLARLGKALVTYPGGCDIGARPIDLHLSGLSKLGVKVQESHGNISCQSHGDICGEVHLDYPSVGATENLMMSAVLSKGTTKIYNCAKEPEIVDLQNFINSMGAKIYGAGTDTIVVEGVLALHSTEYTPIADRIICGTYLLAAATCGGDITLKNVEYEHIYSLITKLSDAGLQVDLARDSIRLVGDTRPYSFGRIETMPYPGFPTDLQPQALVLQTISRGNCVVVENLFDSRLKHVPELVKMGADIRAIDRTAFVSGVERLYGAEVQSSDLRAGAALTIAGLVAEGQTIVGNVSHIDRGYDHLEKDLSNLGADIKRVSAD